MSVTAIHQSTVYATLGSEDQDAFDRLESRLAQVKALVRNTFGESGESFRSLNDETQDNYQWACHQLIEECCSLARGLGSAQAS